jgi:phosphocarrier protein HPr
MKNRNRGRSIVKLVQKVQVKNRLGLHTRPATMIVKLLQHAKSNVQFTCRKETVNAKSILSILMLAAKRNSRITITVDGTDAEEIMGQLVDAFDKQFGEA